MSNNNSNLKTNTTSLQELLNVVNNLPEASNGVELPELTNEGSAEDLISGKELIDGEGNVITGTFTIDEELATQETLLSDQDAKLSELAEILSSKASATPVLQSKTITPTASEQTVTPDSGYDGLRAVTVSGDENLIPENIMSGVSIFGVEGGGNNMPMIKIEVTVGKNNTVYYLDANKAICSLAGTHVVGTTFNIDAYCGIVYTTKDSETNIYGISGNYICYSNSSTYSNKFVMFLEDGGTANTTKLSSGV